MPDDSKPVTIHDAKTHLSRLIARVEAGEEIVIARGGTPVARLVPVEREAGAAAETPRKRRKPGQLKGLITFDERFWDPLPEEELKLWEGG